MARLSAEDSKDFQAILEELAKVRRENSGKEPARASFKDGADVVYKLLGIGAAALALVFWLAGNRSDINSNREAIAALRVEIVTMRAVYDRLEDRVRTQEQKMAKVEK